MVEHNHLVIMAGGVGSRFWPMSTPQEPKQFVDVLGCGRTLIQLTYDRFKSFIPAENTWVVTSASYVETVRRQLPEVPWNHVLLEPCRRNTAPCIAYASWRIKAQDTRANIVVSPSDALVIDTAEYQRVIKSCLKFVAESDAMVTLGMKPTRPETGYGYIQADLSFSTARNKEIFRVDSFKEKPDIDTAKRYIQRNNFFWNAGIFIWNVGTIANALRVYQPPLSQIFEDLLPVYGTAQEQEAINRVFPQCENISIDYAVMEKAEEIYVFPASFGWSDLGTWGSLRDNVERDDHGNALIGSNIDVYETTNCIVHASGGQHVVVQGLDGYIVAQSGDKLLVCRLDNEQRIKQFSEKKEE